MIHSVELLSPAKDKECALEAIRHGADAVYMGAARFGARSAAGNSLEDIEAVARYAHLFGARVYITLNTLLTPAELEQASSLSWDLQRAGADALIVQDTQLMALRQEGALAPLALHASTQMDNRTAEQVKYLEQSGYEQVVLARELNLEQIAQIRAATTVPLEVFVHGALCVSYSGRCQLSEVACGRSANRGECAQYCRLPYSLIDAAGKTLLHHKHLLSLKDMDRSAYLQALIQSGVSSFKIEGRLKDVGYVKNITAYYRQQIDKVLQATDCLKNVEGLHKSSYGTCHYFFTPNPQLTFHRGATPYFTASDGRFQKPVHQWETPKSTGEYIGTLRRLIPGGFEIDSSIPLNNGDGLCFVNSRGQFEGLRINSVKGNWVYPAQWNRGTDTSRIKEGMALYRNANAAFDKQLQGVTAQRTLGLTMTIDNQGTLTLTDERGITASINLCDNTFNEPSRNKSQLWDALQVTLSKLGDTPFSIKQLTISKDFCTFVPVSRIAAARRQVVAQLESARLPRHKAPALAPTKNTALPLPPTTPPVYPADPRTPLMTCKYCLKHALGFCPKGAQTTQGQITDIAGKTSLPARLQEPLYLVTGEHKFRLQFDCAHCQMLLLLP